MRAVPFPVTCVGLFERQRPLRQHPKRLLGQPQPQDVALQRPPPHAVEVAGERFDGDGGVDAENVDVGVDDGHLAGRRLPHGEAGDGHLQPVDDDVEPVRRQKFVESQRRKSEGQVRIFNQYFIAFIPTLKCRAGNIKLFTVVI